MPPTALIFVVCQALANQGPLDVNGFPVGGVKLDFGTCRHELVQIYDTTEGMALKQRPNLSNPNVCSRMSMSETANWEKNHPGWYVKLVKCPRKDGTFPGDLGVSQHNHIVMAGLVPAIHVFLALCRKFVDARHRAGHTTEPYRVGIGFSPR